MLIIHQTDVLREKTSKGLDKFWQGQVLTDGEDFFTRSHTLQTLKDGSLSKGMHSTPVRIEAKNVGRANSTTPREQAVIEIKSDEARKRKKGYVGEGEVKNIRTLPMLAHGFTDRKHHLTYPVCVQRKLDGCRGLQKTGEGFWSRGGDEHRAECVAHLLFDTRGETVDGEIMLPMEAGTFQTTMKALKKYRDDLTQQLRYRVFDLVDETASFPERHQRLRDLVANGIPNIDLVEYEVCKNEVEVEVALMRFIDEGDEGVIVRSSEGGYVIGNRSNGLLKWKVFDNDGGEVNDEEFVITGVTGGRGSFENVAMLQCRTKDGGEFVCCAPGNIAERKDLYARRAELIGKELTVKYQGWTTDKNLPRFPVGIGIRDRSVQG